MEANKKTRLKGVYLVPDPLMMKPHFGPSEHIKAGFAELQRHFDIELVVLGEFTTANEKGSRLSLTRGLATKNGFVGLLRDLKLLIKSNRKRNALVRSLKERKDLDFIYERGQYLDLRGLYAARKMRIAHFYEVNWLNFLGIRQYYTSWFNRVARVIEEFSYNRSKLNFFVGTQHKLIDVSPEKVFTIQNGISKTIIERNADHENIVKEKIRLCFVASLIQGHRFDIFAEALRQCKVLRYIEIHLIGYNFEQAAVNLPSDLKVILHGPKNKDELSKLLLTCNIGVISGGPSYSSFMKLFEYAAHKLCVICPELENVKLMFDSSEVAYFKEDEPASMANLLNDLCLAHQKIKDFGEHIYSKVSRKFTWEHIYDGVSSQIIRKATA